VLVFASFHVKSTSEKSDISDRRRGSFLAGVAAVAIVVPLVLNKHAQAAVIVG
jgi:hypothetical protein